MGNPHSVARLQKVTFENAETNKEIFARRAQDIENLCFWVHLNFKKHFL